MTQEQLWRAFGALPPAARREVEDFITFLNMRYETEGVAPRADATPLREEPFVGMWASREDMEDSAEWVSRIR